MNLASYLEQFRGDVDPLAVCRENGGHNWYEARGIYGKWAECRHCHIRVEVPHEHAPDRMNWLEYHMARLDAELRTS
jgi:hypothetical protein